MIRHTDSHVDHGLTDAQIAYIMNLFADRSAFFIETIELPNELGTVLCGLFGPIMGDAPVPSVEITMRARPPRTYESRLIKMAPRPSRLVTVIAGPHDGHACILYTVFGGPLAPKEPNDPTLKESEREASISFWAEHALSAI